MNIVVSPEEMIKARHNYVRTVLRDGIDGIMYSPSLGLVYDQGLLLVADNSRMVLKRVKEVTSSIAFIGAGDTNELDDVHGAIAKEAGITEWVFSEEDITGLSLANTVSNIIKKSDHPLVVEVVIAELLDPPVLYKLDYKGVMMEEKRFVTLADRVFKDKTASGTHDAFFIESYLRKAYSETYAERLPSLAEALKLARDAISTWHQENQNHRDHTVSEQNLEVAVLSIKKKKPSFRRLPDSEVKKLISS